MQKEENTNSTPAALTAEQVKPFLKTILKVQLRDRENYDGKNTRSIGNSATILSLYHHTHRRDAHKAIRRHNNTI